MSLHRELEASTAVLALSPVDLHQHKCRRSGATPRPPRHSQPSYDSQTFAAIRRLRSNT